MTTIFEVRYDEKWSGSGIWNSSSVNVAAPDVEAAIRKARKYALSQRCATDVSGPASRCTGFRPTGVTELASTSDD